MEALQTGGNWQSLHALLLEYNLVIQPREAGLVIATQDGSVHVKASSVDGGLFFMALTDRWLGPYPIINQQGSEQAHMKSESTFSRQRVKTINGGRVSLNWKRVRYGGSIKIQRNR